MADILGGMSMSGYGNRLQMWGMGSQMDTQSLVEMELAMLQMRNTPINTQKSLFTQEKQHWQDFKTAMTSFQTVTEKLKNLQEANKTVTMVGEGSFAATATKSAKDGTYQVEIDKLATAHKLLSDAQVDSTSPLGISGTDMLNGKEFTITEDMSLNDIVSVINNNPYGINASVISGTMVLTSKEMGAEGAIDFQGAAVGGVLEQLGLVTATGTVKNEIQSAQDASFKVDGVALTSKNNSVTGVIDGVTLNLSKETTSPLSFTINPNNQAIKDAVAEFVNSYNKTIQRINQHTSKGAILQGKSIVSNAKSEMNRALTLPTDSNLMMYELGISLDGVIKDGTVRFDETKLDEQLKTNYSEVFKLLTGENGFATKLFQRVDTLTKENGTLSNKIDGIDRTIKGLDKTLERNNSMMERQSEAILKKYAAFESMMATINLQNQFMTAQLEALNGTSKK